MPRPVPDPVPDTAPARTTALLGRRRTFATAAECAEYEHGYCTGFPPRLDEWGSPRWTGYLDFEADCEADREARREQAESKDDPA